MDLKKCKVLPVLRESLKRSGYSYTDEETCRLCLKCAVSPDFGDLTDEEQERLERVMLGRRPKRKTKFSRPSGRTSRPDLGQKLW